MQYPPALGPKCGSTATRPEKRSQGTHACISRCPPKSYTAAAWGGPERQVQRSKRRMLRRQALRRPPEKLPRLEKTCAWGGRETMLSKAGRHRLVKPLDIYFEHTYCITQHSGHTNAVPATHIAPLIQVKLSTHTNWGCLLRRTLRPPWQSSQLP